MNNDYGWCHGTNGTQMSGIRFLIFIILSFAVRISLTWMLLRWLRDVFVDLTDYIYSRSQDQRKEEEDRYRMLYLHIVAISKCLHTRGEIMRSPPKHIDILFIFVFQEHLPQTVHWYSNCSQKCVNDSLEAIKCCFRLDYNTPQMNFYWGLSAAVRPHSSSCVLWLRF